MAIDLASLYRFLEMDEDDGPRELLYRARVAHYTLPSLILSAVDQAGIAMGPASADELARARERAATYAHLLDSLRKVADVSVLKGPLLSRLYPAGLLRGQGDIDLVVPDERQLWLVVRWVLDRHPVTELNVSTFSVAPRHVAVSLQWDAADNLSDPPYRVEVCTAALTGDFEAVPVRPVLPDDPHVGALLALAEEQLQRGVHARDLIDIAVLGGVRFPPREELAATIGEFRLAPEVAHVLDQAARVHPLGTLAGLPTALPPLVDRERGRRAAYQPPRPGPADDPVSFRLAHGQLLYGMQLRRAEHRADWTCSRVHRTDGGTILRTPVGDYLLVASAIVDPADFERGCAELSRLPG